MNVDFNSFFLLPHFSVCFFAICDIKNSLLCQSIILTTVSLYFDGRKIHYLHSLVTEVWFKDCHKLDHACDERVVPEGGGSEYSTRLLSICRQFGAHLWRKCQIGCQNTHVSRWRLFHLVISSKRPPWSSLLSLIHNSVARPGFEPVVSQKDCSYPNTHSGGTGYGGCEAKVA